MKEIKSLNKILAMTLKIPEFQRPYEWSKSNVYILLEDIINNYKNNKEINIGTIILYKEKESLEIVDGQQRLITLSLLLKVLDSKLDIKLLDEEILCFFETEKKLIDNYNAISIFIEKACNLNDENKLDTDKFLKYLKNNVYFYCMITIDREEAFQLYDSRNSKYKELTPVDLLKAYHLGQIPNNYSKEKKKFILSNWNDNMKTGFFGNTSISKIEYLYNNVLFNIYNWSLNKEIRPFTKDDIYLYKGYDSNTKYKYVKYYELRRSKRCFLINKPFKAGANFFYMTNKFINEFDKIIINYNLNNELENIYFNNKSEFQYINYLYYNALFMFYNKFGNNISELEKITIKDTIFRWSLTHRIKNELVSLQTVNNYVLTTKYNFFYECNNALNPNELFKIEVESKGNEPAEGERLYEMRNKLWNILK